MSRQFINIAIVSLSTLGSRVLGLLRDILIFALLGASQWSSAFIFAFTLPNLFRRLLGEGALTSALIPVLSEAKETDGKPAAFALLNQVFSRVLVALLILTVAAMAILAVIFLIPGLEDRWHLGAQYGIVLMPYMILVCIAAVLGAALNVFGRFGVAALSAVWLNLSMIVALGVGGYFLGDTAQERVWFLCAGVLMGGIIQVAAPMIAMSIIGWKPRLDFEKSQRIHEGMALLIPGLVGAGIMQVNIVVSRVLALAVNETAVSELYLANRMVELPLGVFTIAVTTVIFPLLATMVARSDTKGLREVYGQGLRMILSITIPAMIGLVLLANPILQTLFEWGRFGEGDTQRTAPVLVIFALTIPLYSLAIFSTRCFHALKDMRTPVRIAWWTFLINTGLSLALMIPFGTVGLALANLGSSATQSCFLLLLLQRKDDAFQGARILKALGKIIIAGAAMALIVWLLATPAAQLLPANEKLRALWAVAVGIPIGALVYFGVLWVLKFEDRQLVLNALLRRKRSA